MSEKKVLRFIIKKHEMKAYLLSCKTTLILQEKVETSQKGFFLTWIYILSTFLKYNFLQLVLVILQT